jgi:hypothetical protein
MDYWNVGLLGKTRRKPIIPPFHYSNTRTSIGEFL